MRDGRTGLFVSGVYLDKIRDEAGSLRFAERLVSADLSISGAPPSGFAAVLSHVEHKPLLIFSRTCGGAAP
jgi:hypothetical protein